MLSTKITTRNDDYEGDVQVGKTIRFGRYFQKKVSAPEPIEWLVLNKEGGKALLISKYALDCQKYNTSYTTVTWKTCSLRNWLNGRFLHASFSSNEQNSIMDTTVSADENPSFSTSPGNNTTDKVFLLSITEVNKYFSSDEARKCAPTDYAKVHGAYTNSDFSSGLKVTCSWWLRSPGTVSDYAALVVSSGSVYSRGNYVSNGDVAVRPAMWIKLESLSSDQK